MRRWWIIIGIICSLSIYGEDFTIMSYNVENLFDNQHDTLRDDYQYMPTGTHHWTYSRYTTKVDHIAQVIVNIDTLSPPAVVGLNEVENDHCLRDLTWRLRFWHYRFIHFESPDPRGVDVALLYRSDLFTPFDSVAISVPLNETTTRDILWVSGETNKGDTLYLFICHLPSMLGGQMETEWKRDAARDTLQPYINRLLDTNPNAHIIVMGDMNCSPDDNILGLHNLMIYMDRTRGTHRYQGRWEYLDQFYVSEAFVDHFQGPQVFSPDWLLEYDEKNLGYRPKRTFLGYRYRRDGYSDHLPILLRWQK